MTSDCPVFVFFFLCVYSFRSRHAWKLGAKPASPSRSERRKTKKKPGLTHTPPTLETETKGCTALLNVNPDLISVLVAFSPPPPPPGSHSSRNNHLTTSQIRLVHTLLHHGDAKVYTR